MTSNEEYGYGQGSQDKGKGKETEIVNRFPNPPEPNQNYPRPQMPYRWPTPVVTNDNTDDPDRFCLGCLRVLKHPLSGPTCISCDRVSRFQASGAMDHPPNRYCIVCAKRATYPAIVCNEHYEKQDSLRDFEISTLSALPMMCNKCGKCEKESSEKEFCNRCEQARRIEYHQAVLALEQAPKGRPAK